MKKLRFLLPALVLSLSLLLGGVSAAGKGDAPPEEPTPTPIVTVQPLCPQKPGEPPVEPQDDPIEIPPKDVTTY